MNTDVQQRVEVVNQAVDMASVQVFTASMLAVGVILILVATILFACNKKKLGLAAVMLYGATTFVIPSFLATVAGILIALTALIALGADLAFGGRKGGAA
mgnify:CR=1 FL=1